MDNDFDFNVSQNHNAGFQGNQDIILDDINDKNPNNNKDFNTPNAIQEKPSYGEIVNNPPSEINRNQNITLVTQSTNEEISKSTLDEPIMTTLKRDLYAILNKIKYVAVPKMTERKLEELYNWDLWGPLLFCFLYSIALSTGENKNNESSVFVLIFVIFWIGGFVITFNGRFLGAEIGICQMISLLGYSMFPITLGGIIIGFCRIRNIFVKLIIVVIALIWSCLASIGFIGGLVLYVFVVFSLVVFQELLLLIVLEIN
jgi:hypothetical protein